MAQIIDVPGQGHVEFPDGMSDADIVSAIRRNAAPSTPDAAARPEFSIPGFGQVTTPPNESGFNLPAFVIGAGQKLDSLTQGLRQAKLTAGGTLFTALGMDKQAGINAQAQADQADEMRQKQASYGQLEAIHPGSTTMGAMAPLIPIGPEGLVAAAATEYGSPTDRAKNVALTLAGNKLMAAGGKILTNQDNAAATQAAMLNAQNAERNTTLANAQKIGMQVSPATTNPTFVNRRLEALSGKSATAQDVSINNDAVANAAIRADLGLQPSSPITTDAVRAVRAKAYQDGYEPIAQAGPMAVTRDFTNALDNITAKNTSAAQSFPGAAAPDIKALVDSYRPPNGVFDANHALQATQILRDEARSAFASGDTRVAQAKIAISKAIEDEIQNHLGGDALKNFQAARQLMAKAHSAEDAIREGSGTIEASKFGQMAQRGVPLSGNQKIVGDFANTFQKAVQKPAVVGSPGVSKLDLAMGGLLGTGGVAAGHLLGMGPMGAAMGGLAGGTAPMVLPSIARTILLSKPYQRFMTRPQYGQPSGAMGLLGDALQKGAPIGGLLGYEAASNY